MRLIPPVLLVFAAGCATTAPAVSSYVKVRPDTRAECAARCQEIGMRLGAVVLILNSEGCVCEPESSTSGARGAAAVAGAVVVRAQQEAQERARREEEERRRREAEEQERQRNESISPSAAPVPPI